MSTTALRVTFFDHRARPQAEVVTEAVADDLPLRLSYHHLRFDGGHDIMLGEALEVDPGALHTVDPAAFSRLEGKLLASALIAAGEDRRVAIRAYSPAGEGATHAVGAFYRVELLPREVRGDGRSLAVRDDDDLWMVQGRSYTDLAFEPAD